VSASPAALSAGVTLAHSFVVTKDGGGVIGAGAAGGDAAVVVVGTAAAGGVGVAAGAEVPLALLDVGWGVAVGCGELDCEPQDSAASKAYQDITRVNGRSLVMEMSIVVLQYGRVAPSQGTSADCCQR